MEKQIIVKCIEDNNFEQERRVIHSCYSELILKKENIYYVETSIYDDYVIGQYYTVCPNCGYIILLDENILSEDIKNSAVRSKENDPYQYQKNSLKSQLIYLENKVPKNKALIRTFY